MSPVGKSSNSEGSLDRISNLKDKLKLKILECLPLPDAIKTSQLSRNWRHTWTRMKILKFGVRIVENIGSLTEARFTRIIERILLLHRDSLEQLFVVIPAHFDARRLHSGSWSISLSRKRVQSIQIAYGRPFNGECPNNLEREFIALKTLTLRRVNICSQDDISFTLCLLRSSPNLKTLKISLQQIEHSNEEDEVAVECLEAEQRKGYMWSQILDVNIAGITGLINELMLVNVMLSSCQLLKTWGIKYRFEH
ncbi:hypothetical protein QQ045_017056 [Rhodiola kirilowii]